MVIPEEIGIEDTRFPPLVPRVKALKDIPSDEFIISINNSNYRIFTTVLMTRVIYVFQGSFSLFVFNIDILFLTDTVETEVFPKDFITAIGRSIINDNNEVIRIVLTEQRVKIVLYSRIFIVVVARCNDADR